MIRKAKHWAKELQEERAALLAAVRQQPATSAAVIERLIWIADQLESRNKWRPLQLDPQYGQVVESSAIGPAQDI